MAKPSAETRPPGPRGVPFLGNTLQFGRHTFDFLRQCREEYGDVVHFEVLGQPFYQLNDPDDIHHVLVDNNVNYTKGSFLTKQFGEFLGKGLLLNEGEDWRRQRHLVQPAFDPDRISAYAEMMTDHTERLLNSWQSGTPRNIHADMTQLTLEIAASALLDVDIREGSSELRSAFHDITEEFRKRTARPISLPRWISTPRNRRYQEALRRINEIIYDIIERRRAEPGNGVVSMLLETSSGSDGELTDKQLRDEVITLLFAGHETTAIALTFTWHLLATHPKQEETVVAELDEELDGRSPTVADVPRLEYTQKVLKESLRLYPPVFGVLREPVRDDQIGGYRIPAGATIAMNQIAVHHDPKFFDDPKAFTPERWTDSFEESLPQFAYFPFSGGPRRCIGERFAMLEVILIVATIAQNYQLELLSDPDLTLKPSVTTRPDKPIIVRPQSR